MQDLSLTASQAGDVLFTIISLVAFEKDTSHTPTVFFLFYSTQPTQNLFDENSLPVVTACHPREKGVLAWMV